MNYAFLIYYGQTEFALRNDPERSEEQTSRWSAYARALAEAGVLVAGAGLQLPETATTVKLREGQRLVQDGPYADTKEQLAGFFLIDAPDLDGALEWAHRMPVERDTLVEIRAGLPPNPAAASMPAAAVNEAHPQYTVLIYESADDFAARKDPARQPGYRAQWLPYSRVLKEAGAFVHGAGLEPPETAVTIRLKDGRRLVHDGPYAETKEQLGGYFIVSAPDLDAALDWAARCPTATTGVIEVRPNMKIRA